MNLLYMYTSEKGQKVSWPKCDKHNKTKFLEWLVLNDAQSWNIY